MSVDKFYDSVDNCIQAIVYQFGVPDRISKYKRKINFFYGQKTGKNTMIEFIIQEKTYIINVNDGKKASFDIQKTGYYQSIRRGLK